VKFTSDEDPNETQLGDRQANLTRWGATSSAAGSAASAYSNQPKYRLSPQANIAHKIAARVVKVGGAPRVVLLVVLRSAGREGRHAGCEEAMRRSRRGVAGRGTTVGGREGGKGGGRAADEEEELTAGGGGGWRRELAVPERLCGVGLQFALP
jgi:hypothetical protein